MIKTPLEQWILKKIGASGEKHLQASLASYQLDMLQEILDYARLNSLFYGKHLEKVPCRLSRLADIEQVPFTTAEDLRTEGRRFLCVPQNEIERVVTLRTSGTTGEPKRLYFTADDIELTIDFFRAGMSTFTAQQDRVLILLPGGRPASVGDLLGRALQRLECTAVQHGPVRNAHATLKVIQQESITCLVGIPAQVLWLARMSRGEGLNIKSVLLSTDYVPEAVRGAIEQRWGCSVYNHYGLTETGLGGGVDCSAQSGYHLREADLYVEIIDYETGVPVPDGSFGEVVITTLTRRGMPLIRYRTGDCSRFLADACSCGTQLRRMEHVQGRYRHRLPAGRGNVLTIQALDEALFPIEDIINYTASVETDGNSLLIHLCVMTAGRRNTVLREEIRDAVCRAPSLRRAFGDGSLKTGHITFTEQNWITDGVAKREIDVF